MVWHDRITPYCTHMLLPSKCCFLVKCSRVHKIGLIFPKKSLGFDSLCKIWPSLNSYDANLWLNLLTMQTCSWGQYVCFKKNCIDVQRPAFNCTSDPIMCRVLVPIKINNRQWEIKKRRVWERDHKIERCAWVSNICTAVSMLIYDLVYVLIIT